MQFEAETGQDPLGCIETAIYLCNKFNLKSCELKIEDVLLEITPLDIPRVKYFIYKKIKRNGRTKSTNKPEKLFSRRS